MHVLFYGRLADMVGRELTLDLADRECSVKDLREEIAARHPQARDQLVGSRVRACVADSIVPDSHVLDASATIEFFPPVSGG